MPWLWESDRFPRGSLQVDHAKNPSLALFWAVVALRLLMTRKQDLSPLWFEACICSNPRRSLVELGQGCMTSVAFKSNSGKGSSFA